MACARCEALKGSLDKREQAYERAKQRLDEMGKYLSQDDFRRAHLLVDSARADCKAARIELETHQSMHRAITSATGIYKTELDA